MMSVPIATCTVTGISSRAAAASEAERACCGLSVRAGSPPTACPMPRPRRTPSRDRARSAAGRSPPPCRNGRVRAPRRRPPTSRPTSASSKSWMIAGAVHRDRRDEPALHQIDQHRRQAGLDDVGADAPDDSPVRRARRADRRDDRLEVGAGENRRQRIDKRAHAAAARHVGPREVGRVRLALAGRSAGRCGRRRGRTRRS